MKNKKIIFVFCILYSSLCSKAQLGETAFHLNSSFNHTVSNPLIRYSENYNTTIAYYEKNFRGIFVIYNDLLPINDTIELPFNCYVLDFEILNGLIYFCGQRANSSISSDAIVGKFDFLTYVNTLGNTILMNIDIIPLPRDICKLEKMVVYNYYNNQTQILEPLVMAIGYGGNFNMDDMTYDQDAYFFIARNMTNSLVWTEELTQRFYDIVETDNYVILVGTELNPPFPNPIGFKKLRKDNPLSNIKDVFHVCYLREPEPLTFVLAENIQGTDIFVTSTHALIGGREGTVVRCFNAETMKMINSQFVPSYWGKTQPYELQHIHGTDTLLILQGYTDAIEPMILYINYNEQNNYITPIEYYVGFDFYSIDKYYKKGYIATGYSASNPVYLIRDVNQDVVCVIQEYFEVEIIPNHTLKSNNDLLNIAPCNSTTIFTSFTSSSANFTTDCP